VVKPDVELFTLVSSQVLTAWFSSDSVGNGALLKWVFDYCGRPLLVWLTQTR
jgi:hypothetical protein